MSTVQETTEDLSLPEGFGAPSGGGVKFKRRRMKKDSPILVVRQLPAMKGLLQRKEPGVYAKVHYGWNGVNPANPTKPAFRPFLCCEEKRNGMVVQECDACKYRAEYIAKQEDIRKAEKAIVDKVRAKAKEKNVTDESKIVAAISKELEPLKQEKDKVVEWLKDHGIDSKWKFYAVDKDGEPCIAEVPFKAKKAMLGAVDELKATVKNYPTSLTKGKEMPIQINGKIGVFFKFTRTGDGFGTDYTCNVNRILDPESGSEKIDYHIVSNETLKQAMEILPCLVEETEKLRLAPDKIKALVDHSRGLNGGYDPYVVDSIMGKAVESKPANVPATIPVENTPTVEVQPSLIAETAKTEVLPETKPEPKAEVKAETKSVVDFADASDAEFDSIFG